MPKLSDTQSTLLAHAARHDSYSVHPLPTAMLEGNEPTARALTAIGQLLKRSLLEERETTTAVEAYRTDGDIGYGVFVTTAGLAAIGVEVGSGEADDSAASPVPVEKRATKAAGVLALLQRPDGATLAELIAATGWLPHTTRAALTGLRKKGHAIERSKRGDETCYQVAG